MILYMMGACILPVLCIAVFPAEGGKVGKYDGLMGRYLSNRERFADLMNGIMFDGKQMIDPKSLEREAGDYFETEGSLEADQSKVERKSQGKYRRVQRRYRDLKMRSRQNGQFRIFALENQSVVDYTMPLRCMEYDFLDYQEQLNNLKETYKIKKETLRGPEKLCGIKKKDRLLPVYTICLYHGEEEWDGPRSLFDMTCIDGEDKKNFSDYQMRLYCVNEQQDFQVFHTELRQFFQALVYRKNKEKLKELIENSVEYQNLSEETFEMIIKFLGMSELWKNRNNFMNHNDAKEGYNMCQAIRELRAEERAIGREEGKEIGIEQGIEQMILENLEEHRTEETIVDKLVRWFSLTKEQAKRYYDKCARDVV